MRNFIKKLYYFILYLLPTNIIAYIEILRSYHKVLNLKNPVYFGEKEQWMKIYADLTQYSVFADKYAVREYVKDKIGNEHLVKLIGVYNNVDDIPFDKLPNKFVLKANHGCGYNIICKNKANLNIKKTKKQLNKWLKIDYASIKGEEQYKNIPRKIVCEEYIEDKNGCLLDYKYFCFGGKIKMIEVCFNRSSDMKIDFYDRDWNKLPVLSGFPKSGHPNNDKPMEKPENADEIAAIVEQLCAGFPFVRTDVYVVDDKIYFGELTFISGSGSDPFYPLEEDKKIASWIDLSSYPQKRR